jgi:hypothetical protein
MKTEGFHETHRLLHRSDWAAHTPARFLFPPQINIPSRSRASCTPSELDFPARRPPPSPHERSKAKSTQPLDRREGVERANLAGAPAAAVGGGPPAGLGRGRGAPGGGAPDAVLVGCAGRRRRRGSERRGGGHGGWRGEAVEDWRG